MIELTLLLLGFRQFCGLRVSQLSWRSLDSWGLRLERSLGGFGAAAVIGILGFTVACLYVSPDIKCDFLGEHYSELATAPFSSNIDNPVRYRFLTPLISFALGLRGDLIVVTNWLIAIWFIALAYSQVRRITARPALGLLAVGILVGNMPVIGSVINAGYCDALKLTFVLLMWRYRRTPLVFYALFFLSLLNHESIIFMIPWFLYLSWSESDRKWEFWEPALGYSASIGLWLLIRSFIGAEASGGFSLEYYWQQVVHGGFYPFDLSFPFHGIGIFSVFKLLWFVPVLAIYYYYREGDRKKAWLIALPIICAYLQMFTAYDSTRLMTMGFMSIILALPIVFNANILDARRWLGWLTVANMFVPTLYTAGDIIEIHHSLLFNIISRSL